MSVGALAVAVLFWAGGLARAPSALRVRDRRPLCLALLAFAVALTVDIPAVYVRVDSWFGVPNVADLIEHCFAMLGVFAMLVTLRGLVGRGDSLWWTRTRIAVLVAAVAASAGLFLAARLPVESANFTDRYGHLPLIAAYWSITVAYFGVVLIELAQVAVTRSGRARRMTLRLGLRMVGAGVALGVVYSAIKIVELVVDEDSPAGAVRQVADRLDPMVLASGVAVVGVGLLLPAAETTWRHAWRSGRERLALLRLRPLWLDLTEAMPEVVLGERPSLWADLCGGNVSFRLYRRVIEIRDVVLEVRLGEALPALGSARAAMLLSGLATEVHRDEDAVDGAAGQDARRELRPLLELAREWHPRRRRGPGVTA